MTSTAPHRPKVDVCITDTLDRICLIPLEGYDRQDIRKALREVIGDIPMRSSADGVSIPSRYAHLILNAGKALDIHWRGLAKLYVENRQRTQGCFRWVKGRIEEIKAGGVAVAEDMLKDLADVGRMDDHQKINVALMTLPELPGMCVFDEQGAGKTVTFIYAFDLLVHRDEADVALVIAPKSMVPEWPNDLRRFKGDLYQCAVISGVRREKRAAISSDADFFVTNFETTVSMEGELTAMLRRHRGRAVIAIDESFYVKNLDTKRTRAIRRLREYCGKAYVLCGTPAPNSPQDLVQQFNIVDFGYTFADVELPDDREASLPVVQEAIEERGLYIRNLKSNVLPDLPHKRFHRILLPLEPGQRRLYAGALKDLILDLRSIDDATFHRQISSFLARRSALLQICSNPVSFADGYSEVPAKLRALDSLLEELVLGRGEKVIIWSFYTASIDAIVSRYNRFNPTRYDGTVREVSERRDSVRRFQEDDETMLLIANPAAAGAGLTLHRACIAIYESMSNQAAHYLQSLDRIHRRGQTRDVDYLILLCDETIEVEEYERLKRKELASQTLLGDPIETPLTRETMLEEALKAIMILGEGI